MICWRYVQPQWVIKVCKYALWIWYVRLASFTRLVQSRLGFLLYRYSSLASVRAYTMDLLTYRSGSRFIHSPSPELLYLSYTLFSYPLFPLLVLSIFAEWICTHLILAVFVSIWLSKLFYLSPKEFSLNSYGSQIRQFERFNQIVGFFFDPFGYCSDLCLFSYSIQTSQCDMFFRDVH
jgi:hypothetical protein